jgi:predicted TPR repeat methyltransferase
VLEQLEVDRHQIDVGCAIGLAASGIGVMRQKFEKITLSAKILLY